MHYLFFTLFLIGLLIWGLLNKDRNNIKEFPSTIIIENYTNLPTKQLTHFTKTLLHKIIKIDTIKVTFHYMYFETLTKVRLVGLIRPHPIEEKSYLIFLSKWPQEFSMQEVITHELVHLQQMETGKLKIIDHNTLLWNDTEIINLEKISYHDRKFEIEAYDKSVKWLKEYIRLYYKKS